MFEKSTISGSFWEAKTPKIRLKINAKTRREKNKITHCIISTTPSKQIMYLKKLQFTNMKIYVEKPAFTDKEDLKRVQDTAKKITNNNVFVGSTTDLQRMLLDKDNVIDAKIE